MKDVKRAKVSGGSVGCLIYGLDLCQRVKFYNRRHQSGTMAAQHINRNVVRVTKPYGLSDKVAAGN